MFLVSRDIFTHDNSCMIINFLIIIQALYDQSEFYDSIDDSMLKFAVIIAKHNGKWVFCKHRERSTWEVPGGHREQGEDILETAKRELYEETGAINFEINPICIYSVTVPDNFKGKETLKVIFRGDTYV